MHGVYKGCGANAGALHLNPKLYDLICSLNSFKRVIIGDYIGEYYRGW